jgi:hypothetical protein
MKSYEGGCHCGKVRFRIRTDFSRITECNCSICTKKGTLNHRVAPENFELLSGGDALSVYQFGTRTAKHYFCTACGIHAFSRPRAVPEMFAVNVRCLDDFHQAIAAAKVAKFDGLNWEQAVKEFKFIQ